MTTNLPSTALGSRSLDRLPAAVAAPTYDRSALRRSIVHIGVGGFHRAHFATYVHELCCSGHRDWSIVGAGVLPGDAAMAEALASQDHLYSLITRGPDTTTVEVIGSIVDYIHAVPDPEALVDAIADPATQIISVTVTEGGYPVDDRTGEYIPASPNAGAGSAFGVIVSGLQRRRQHGGGGLTIISCDNIIGNGGVTRTAALGEARRIDDGLASWIADSVAFPNSMVDRITPATTDADRQWLSENLGVVDNWPVVTEPFRQWVVEDSFGADRLPLEELDVLVTDDVEPYELMKLRMLNAAHSILAYLAWLQRIDTVDAAMADRGVREYVLGFLEREARPVLPAVDGIDLTQYTASIVERFANPNIRDQIGRLCLDGSAKFPKFLLPTIRAQLDRGGPIALGALALAGWCEYLAGPRENLAADPLLEKAVAHALRSRVEPMAFLEFTEVFGDDLPRSSRFVDAFAHALQLLRERGVQAAIEAALDESIGADGDARS